MDNMLFCEHCHKFATLAFLTKENQTFCSKECYWTQRFCDENHEDSDEDHEREMDPKTYHWIKPRTRCRAT